MIDMFNNKIKNITGRMKNDFIDIELIKGVKIEFNSEIIKLLIEDYYVSFLLTKFINIDVKEFIPYLKFIVDEGMKKIYPNNQLNENPIQNYMKIILFIQYFNEYIIILLQILYDLNSIIDNILEKIKIFIIIFDEEKNKNLSLNETILNNIQKSEPFTSISNSLCEIIITNVDMFNGEKSKKFNEIGNKIAVNVSKMKYILGVKCSKVLIINIIFKIYEIISFGNYNQDVKEKLEQYSKIVKDENKYITANQKEDAEKSLEDEYNFLKNLLESHSQISKEEKYKICILFLCNKYRTEEILQDKIFEIILDDSNKEILIYSKILFSLFFINHIDGLIPIDETFIENEENEFLNFIYLNDNCILKLINEKCLQNDILAEMLISIFETRINKYFEEIKNSPDNELIVEKIFGSCKSYLNTCIVTIENNQNEAEILQNIGKIYSITYIKCFLNFYIELLYNKEGIEGIFGDNKIIDDILFKKKNKFRKTLKLYIMKLIFKFCNKNYEQYLKECRKEKFEKYIIQDKKQNKEIPILEYAYFPINKLEETFDKISSYYEISLFNKVLKNDKNAFYCLIDILINIHLSKMTNENLSYFVNTLNKQIKNLNDIEKQFYESLIKSKEILTKMNNKQYIIFLTSFKLMSILLHNQNESFYKNIINTENIEKYLSSLYIIGGVPKEQKLMESYIKIERELKEEKDPLMGHYICECGADYVIEPCGYPSVKSKCINCSKTIGGTDHKLYKEKDFRVFLDESQRNESWKQYSFGQEVKNKLLSEFFNDDIIKLLASEEKGLNKITYVFENINEKKIRNLSEVSFNILHFIFLSSLLFNFIINGKDIQKQLKDYFPRSRNLLEYIYYKYKKITEHLSNKKINIGVFFNLLYEELITINNKEVKCSTKGERREFEIEFNNIITKIMKEAKKEEIEKKYLEKNKEIIKLDNLQLILNETVSPYLYIEEYEYLNYFTIPNFASLKDLENQFNYLNEEEKIKYPILKAFFDYYKNEKLNNMKKLLDINPFENELLNYYSYSKPITREEAIEKKIGKEIKNIQNKYPNKKINDNFYSFKKAWNQIYHLFKKYICQDINTVEIDDNTSLSLLLADNIENRGVQISGMYYEFLTIHNIFVNSIIDNIKLNKDSKFSFFINQLEKKILIQNVSENEIFDFSKIKAEYFYNLEEIIEENSFRNIPVSNDNKVNYMKYKEIIYNFEYIDELLGQGLLFGKKKFSDELTFVMYEGDIFNKNSPILINYAKKYEQVELSEILKNELFKLQNSEGFNYNEVLFSILILLFYLLQKNTKNVLITNNNQGIDEQIYNKETSLENILEEKPEYISINEDLNQLLKSHEYKIKHLIDVFEYIELWNYNEIIKNVDNKYKKNLEDGKIKLIEEYFQNERDSNFFEYKTINTTTSNKSNNINDKVITKSELSKATRKFISRHLSSKRKNQLIPPDNDLFLNLRRDDLWKKDFVNSTEFDKEMEDLRIKININVEHAVKFYELIGEKKELEKEGIEQIIIRNNSNIINNSQQIKKRNKKREVG